ncbi:hypothetical protein [Thomasclavelia sp.]|uniref:hypothetical protein n=1 Tax=Thomasclavelia sp. TaxID=3025757 RepID=UPI0025D7C29B|nr:hypothetical protein [Thomasclavelia sp.]
MKKIRQKKKIKALFIIDTIWLLAILIYYIMFKKMVSIYTIGVFIFTNFCIYIGSHDKK